MRSPVFYFFLLILRISLNLSPNTGYKQRRFSKTLLEKGLKFFSSNKNNIVIFHLSFMLLLIEIDPIPEKQGHKRDIFGARDTDYLK